MPNPNIEGKASKDRKCPILGGGEISSAYHISVKLGNAFSSVVRKLPNTCVIGYFKNRVFYEL